MNYTDATIQLIELLSCLIFDEPGQIGFFESEHRALNLEHIIFWVHVKPIKYLTELTDFLGKARLNKGRKYSVK